MNGLERGRKGRKEGRGENRRVEGMVVGIRDGGAGEGGRKGKKSASWREED
jgi:hypothetical protein